MPREVTIQAEITREKFFWPDAQLNFWTIIIWITGGLILGVFAFFIQVQGVLRQGVPWLFAYGVTVGALTITFLIVVNLLVAQRRLLPGLMMMFSFILLILFLVGVIETGIILFGNGNVQRNCQTYVNNSVQSGPSQAALAYIAQQNICNCWYAVFSFWLVGVFFFIWMLIMAAQVARGDYDRIDGKER